MSQVIFLCNSAPTKYSAFAVPDNVTIHYIEYADRKLPGEEAKKFLTDVKADFTKLAELAERAGLEINSVAPKVNIFPEFKLSGDSRIKTKKYVFSDQCSYEGSQQLNVEWSSCLSTEANNLAGLNKEMHHLYFFSCGLDNQ